MKKMIGIALLLSRLLITASENNHITYHYAMRIQPGARREVECQENAKIKILGTVITSIGTDFGEQEDWEYKNDASIRFFLEQLFGKNWDRIVRVNNIQEHFDPVKNMFTVFSDVLKYDPQLKAINKLNDHVAQLESKLPKGYKAFTHVALGLWHPDYNVMVYYGGKK